MQAPSGIGLAARIFAAAAALFFAGNAAWAAGCDGDQVLFEDHFADDAGGWALKDAVEVKDGAFTFKLAPDDMEANLNITYTVNDADVCADVVWPEGEQPTLGAGLLFWGEDGQDYYQFGVLNTGRYWIARKQDGKWLVIAENIDSSAINSSPGATNTLETKVSGDTVSFFVNGTKLRDLRGQPPAAGWRFGLSGDNFDKDKSASLAFRHVKATN